MASKIFGTIICCFIAIIFLFSSLIFIIETKNIIVPHFFWKSIQCRIDSASVDRINSRRRPYKIKINYSYKYDSNRYTSGQIYVNSPLSPKSYETYEDALALLSEYQTGSEKVTYINPARPSEAILELRPVTNLFFCIPFTIIFGAIGLFLGYIGLYAIWFGKHVDDSNKPAIGGVITKKPWEQQWGQPLNIEIIPSTRCLA